MKPDRAEFAAAEQAGLAAIDMLERVAKLPPVSGLKLAVRIGLHSGTADAEQAAAGARRIAARAGSDQILACPALVGELPDQAAITIRARPDLRTALTKYLSSVVETYDSESDQV